MEKENARKQTLEQLHERRKQVVGLHKKDIKIMQIVAMTGLSYPAVRACIDLFDAGGCFTGARVLLTGCQRMQRKAIGHRHTMTHRFQPCIYPLSP